MCSSIVIIGQSALSEKTEESARRVETHFDNQLKVSIDLGYADDIAHAKQNIACAKLIYEGYNSEEIMKANHTICARKILAMTLQDQNCGGWEQENC
jgi:hypothetical protein